MWRIMTWAGVLAVMPIGASEGQDRSRQPNDPLFAYQASFFAAGRHERVVNTRLGRRDSVVVAAGAALDLPRAWSYTTGSRAIVVAVLDDGFFYTHEDIAPNVWRNPGESGTDSLGRRRESNGLDDDRDGYVDDVVGWDFVFADPDPDPYVYDGRDRSRIAPYWHSISALGIIGAKGDNGIGIAGINWDVSMMLLKIGAQGTSPGEIDTLRAARAAQAIRFAADHGARVINWSGFVADKRPAALEALRQAIVYAAAKNVLLVAGAGNDAHDNDIEDGCIYPQCFDEPNLLRVAQIAADGSVYRYQTGGQWRGSNVGARRVELAAMGEHLSTSLRNAFSTYELTNGTSNAGPVVAGAAALVLAVRPDLSALDLKRLLMETGTELPTLRGKTVTGRTVNAVAALQRACERGCTSRQSAPPAWVKALGYRAPEMFPIRRGYLGMPFLDVAIGDSSYELLFDTGNMVGLTLATRMLDRLHLPEVGRWNQLDSDGRVTGSFRRVRAPVVRALGVALSDHVIHEFSDSVLRGLIGPDALPGTRFALDYEAGILAITSSNLDSVPRGFAELALTRSSRFPRLILATGRVNGRPVLIEFDTGASRTNIDPELVRALELVRSGNGVRIDSLALGPLAFSVPSARVNPKAGIDPALNPPIQLAIGSDILSQLILMVDYSRGRLLLARSSSR